MRITFLTSGTRGDVQPLLALATGLEARGARCAVAASEDFRALVEGQGIAFRPVRGSVAELMRSGELAGARLDRPLQAMALLADPKFLDRLVAMQEDFAAACDDAEAIVYHTGVSIGHYLARSKRVPSVLASPFPFLETDAYPSLLFAKPKLPRALNRTTHRLFQRAFWTATRKPLQLYLERTAGKGVRLENPMRAEDRMVVSCSPRIFPTPPRSPSFGFWFLEEPSGFAPPPGLAAFLAAGEKPVYVGFGSMGHGEEARRHTATVLEAVRRTGVRAILATGSGGLARPDEVPAHVHVIDAIPHGWLFPRCALAVHHGGAGTTAEGFRAGIPQVLVPHGNDQFGWGRRVHELGAGPAPIPVGRLTADRLAHAIAQARAASVVDAARALGEGVRGEHGVRDAADWILGSISAARPSG